MKSPFPPVSPSSPDTTLTLHGQSLLKGTHLKKFQGFLIIETSPHPGLPKTLWLHLCLLITMINENKFNTIMYAVHVASNSCATAWKYRVSNRNIIDVEIKYAQV